MIGLPITAIAREQPVSPDGKGVYPQKGPQTGFPRNSNSPVKPNAEKIGIG